MAFRPLEPYYPWKSNTTDMRWNVLIMCKLLFVLLVLHAFIPKIGDPFLPHFAFLDFFHVNRGIFGIACQALFIFAGIFLVFNIRARLMSCILGLVIFLVMLSSKPMFRNHLFICGCAFFLASLHKKEESPFLLYYQMVLIYFGAALNKIWQLDWWNGIYMHNWMAEILNNQAYAWVYGHFNSLAFAKFLSWFSMAAEVVIAIFLIFKKTRKHGIFMILFFHTILFTVTMERFGHFLEDILIILIAFVPKTSAVTHIQCPRTFLKPLRTLLYLLDWNQTFRIKKSGDGLRAIHENKLHRGVDAVRHMLLASGGFFYVLFMADLSIRFLFGTIAQHLILVTIAWGLILFFYGPGKNRVDPTIQVEGDSRFVNLR